MEEAELEYEEEGEDGGVADSVKKADAEMADSASDVKNGSDGTYSGS